MPADYNAIQATNFSTLKHIAESPRAYRHALDNPPEDSDVFKLGRLFHTLTLEPGKVSDEYAIWPAIDPETGKATRRAGPKWKAFEEENEGKTIMREQDAEEARTMSDAVLRSPIARQWIERATHIEQTLIWTDPDTGIKLKGRADMIDILGVCDLKGYREVTPGAMQKACNLYYSHCQVAMYLDGARACGLTSGNEGRILAVDKGPLYEVAPIILSADYIEAGRKVYKGWLRTLANCLERDEWPGMYHGMEYLLFPNRWTPGMPEESDNDEIEV
jgi:hypothetical protein